MALILITACGEMLAPPYEGERKVSGTERESGNEPEAISSFSSSPNDASANTDSATFETKKDAVPTYAFAPSVSPVVFSDDFERSDGALGNGWFAKHPSLAIFGGEAHQSANLSNADALALHSDSLLDTEIAASITLGDEAGSWHALFARAQEPLSSEPGHINAYMLGFNAVQVFVGVYKRDASGGIGPGGCLSTFSTSLVVGQTYRAILRVSGRDPVALEAAVLRTDGSLIGGVRCDDSGPYRIVTGGRSGFGSGSRNTRFDEFTLRTL